MTLIGLSAIDLISPDARREDLKRSSANFRRLGPTIILISSDENI
jgi:hypothetical protein